MSPKKKRSSQPKLTEVLNLVSTETSVGQLDFFLFLRLKHTLFHLHVIIFYCNEYFVVLGKSRKY